MRRRDFLAVAGAVGAAAVFPPIALAQQAAKVRRVVFLWNYAADDPAVPSRMQWYEEALREKGWIKDTNIRLDYRFDAGNAQKFETYAAEMTAAPPDVILVNNAAAMLLGGRYTKTIPIIQSAGSDPVVLGLATNLAHPDGNVTGFPSFVYSLGGKWLDLLADLAPSVKHVGYLYNPSDPPIFQGYLAAMQTAAQPRGVDVTPFPVNSDADIEAAIATVAGRGNAGLIFQPDNFLGIHRAQAIVSATNHRLPSVSAYDPFVVEGGLASYAADAENQSRLSAGYIDAVLRGTKVSELPIQPPNILDLVINLNAAKAIGLTVPASVLFRAVRVIE
jgi:putative ABC transport system substrate-binding protein